VRRAGTEGAAMSVIDVVPPGTRTAESPAPDDLLLVTAVAERTRLQDQFYVRYRRPLLQVFLHRRIDRDAAEDLLQRTFLQAIKKIRAEGLSDPSNLGGYLYRTACKLATAYWRGELARQHDTDRDVLTNVRDEALSLEERLDHEQLARCVRELIGRLPVQRDREVLERFYLREESRTQIRESLQLTDMQFNQVLWRARQRFGDILRSHGLAGRDTGFVQST
jgi:RNA polymerase sigma factor (sigma-70 family)